MGVRPQRLTRMSLPRQARRGAALPAALFGLVTITLLTTAIFAASRLQTSATRNRESSARAHQLAEAGIAHAVTVTRDSVRGWPFTRLLRGWDNTVNTADDGRLVGYGLSNTINIPAAGRTIASGSYTVEITDDNDGDGNLKNDANMRVNMRCTATTTDGGRAVLDVVLGVSALPAIAANGNIALGNSIDVLGLCGGVHANGNATITGSPIVSGRVTATGTATGSSVDTLGVSRPAQGGQLPVTIPQITYNDFCGAPGTNATTNRTDVEFWMTSTGSVYQRGNPVPFPATAVKQFGWQFSGSTWTFSNPSAWNGRACIEGNVSIASGVGSAALPVQWSLIATRSVAVSGNPYIVPVTGDSVLIVAGGDVSITGNPSGTARSYEGLIYADEQCVVAGNPTIYGQLLCRNGPAGPGTQYATSTSITGNPIIQYGCGGYLSRRRIVSWLQRVE